MKRKWAFLGIAFGVMILFCWGIISQTLLLRCQSDSLSNVSYLLIKKGSSFERGDIVCLQNHKSPFIEADQLLAKHILGLSGDRIQREGNFLKIIPQGEVFPPSPLPLLSMTSKGEPLTPLSMTMIPEGYVFVAGDHPKSFDSRYEEFGLVNIENIKGRAVFTW